MLSEPQTRHLEREAVRACFSARPAVCPGLRWGKFRQLPVLPTLTQAPLSASPQGLYHALLS